MDGDPAEATHSFTANVDICQQLLTRYARSSAGQHCHLCAAAAATRSIIQSSSLPLTPISYFAATITSFSNPKSLDSNALGALTSFISIVLPLVGRREINPEKAVESIKVLAATVEDSGANLGTSGVRAVVKCVGVLVAEFCNLKEWDSVSLGFEWLVKFSLDRRPKVRKCAQDCLLTVFKSFESSAVIKKASKSIYSLLKDYMPLGVELSALEVADGAKREPVSKAEHQDFLQLLNVIKHIAPHFSPKLRMKMLTQLSKIMSSKFTAVTRHLLDVISAIFATSGTDIDISNAEDILWPLVSYVSLGKKNPVDSVLFAANLAKTALRELPHDGINEWTTYFPTLTESVAGFLSYGDDVAAQTSTILRELIDQHIDEKFLSAIESQEMEDMITDNAEFKAIQTTCTALHNVLSASPQTLSEHFFSVVSFLFLKLGVISEIFMKHILLKLADLVNAAPSGASEVRRLKDCIGYAVAAMGPEKLLALLPISVNTKDFSCSNTWLIPILEKNIFGSSLRFFMEHIVPVAESFEKGSRKVKKSVTGQDLQAHAHGCWGLLPAFCRQPSDTYKTFGALAELLIPFLKKDSFMLGSIAIGLQELVNENKIALVSDERLVEVTEVHKTGNLDEFAIVLQKRRVYTRKMAGKNIKALASGASELLQALTDVFFESPPETREHLKGAIGCLLSISNASVAKQLFIDSLKKFQLVDYFDVHGEVDSNTDGLANEKESGETDAKRCLILDLASCMVEGSDNDLVNMLFYVVKRSLQASEEAGQMEAYHTLSRILEKHSWFCSSQFDVVMDVLTGMKPSANVTSLKSRLTCLQTLLIHGLTQTLDDENTKAFLILNEIILTLKDSNEENRKAAYEALDGLSSKLRSSSDASYELYHKLLNMFRGYLSVSSPQIKSGVVSALSVLLYNDPDICITAPEIVPAVMELLHSKAVEVIKAVLGFVKVLVSCLKPDEVHRFLPDIVDGIIRWSSVSRHHFKTKIIVILEILMRKCGPAAVKVLVPEKYKEFVQGVVVNRHGKTKNKEDGSKDDAKPETSDSSLRGPQNRKRDKSAMSSKEEGSERPWKRKRDDNKKDNGGGKSVVRGGRSDDGALQKGESNRPRGKQYTERTEMKKNNNKGNIRGPAVASKSSKHKKVGRKDKKSAA
ncbi:ribosomal RNA-processing protein 12 [Phtheirospermum japonicum]|uniref:Ribosomal RNA-processing protein 12 n=1 Tax=Phtheirospermum japonicum TaxID=374723 RepID=A0A830BZF4_9LAMI|nr:ribosomal RNA-processing protein 12 [Phtheirospermum japonicum]